MIYSNERLASFRVEQLQVVVYGSRRASGEAAAQGVAEHMSRQAHRRISIVFAAAPSQEEFLAALAAQPSLDWGRVVAFQMDEYLGLPAEAPQSFARFLRERLFDQVRPGAVHLLNGQNDPAVEIARYGRLVAEMPPEITCAGIGENGHLAFNDPPFADFADPAPIKVVQLAEPSRVQQVHDGCFDSIHQVPTGALTLTIPILLSASFVSCVVPGPLKAAAVERMLLGPITPDCPASILRRHSHAVLYLDPESAAQIPAMISQKGETI